jgi:hypothetical protein
MIARYITAVAVGGGVTFGLLFIMQLLIATGEEAVTDAAATGLLAADCDSAAGSGRGEQVTDG